MSRIFFIIVALFLTSCSGYGVVPSSELEIQKIIEVPGKTKLEIFENTKVWIAKNFKSSKAVIEYENRESGNIIGNGSVRCYINAGITPIDIIFTLEIDVKDGRIRVKATNLRQAQGYAFFEKYKEAVFPEINALIADLENNLQKMKSNSDW